MESKISPTSIASAINDYVYGSKQQPGQKIHAIINQLVKNDDEAEKKRKLKILFKTALKAYDPDADMVFDLLKSISKDLSYEDSKIYLIKVSSLTDDVKDRMLEKSLLKEKQLKKELEKVKNDINKYQNKYQK